MVVIPTVKKLSNSFDCIQIVLQHVIPKPYFCKYAT